MCDSVAELSKNTASFQINNFLDGDNREKLNKVKSRENVIKFIL